MIKKDYVIINCVTKKVYAQRDTFPEALVVANRKVNGLAITREDYERIKKEETNNE